MMYHVRCPLTSDWLIKTGCPSVCPFSQLGEPLASVRQDLSNRRKSCNHNSLDMTCYMAAWLHGCTETKTQTQSRNIQNKNKICGEYLDWHIWQHQDSSIKISTRWLQNCCIHCKLVAQRLDCDSKTVEVCLSKNRVQCEASRAVSSELPSSSPPTHRAQRVWWSPAVMARKRKREKFGDHHQNISKHRLIMNHNES